VYDIEYYEEDNWWVWDGTEYRLKWVQYAIIRSDSIDEIGLAIDDVNLHWPGGPREEDDVKEGESCSAFEATPFLDELDGETINLGKLARTNPLINHVFPSRVNNRWQYYWGRILWE